eukprot:1082-Heterococcus_DN1.PRE.4
MGKRAMVRLVIGLCFEITCVHGFTFSTPSVFASKAAALRSAHCAPLAGKIKSSFGLDQEGEVYTWDLEVRNSSALYCWLDTQLADAVGVEFVLLQAMSLAELKEECRLRELPTSGTKAALQARLKEAKDAKVIT